MLAAAFAPIGAVETSIGSIGGWRHWPRHVRIFAASLAKWAADHLTCTRKGGNPRVCRLPLDANQRTQGHPCGRGRPVPPQRRSRPARRQSCVRSIASRPREGSALPAPCPTGAERNGDDDADAEHIGNGRIEDCRYGLNFQVVIAGAKRSLHSQNVRNRRPGQHGSHTAANIETDAARGNDAAKIGIERRDSANRKAVAPMPIRHHIRSADDARQRRHTRRLLDHFVVHMQQKVLISMDDDRDRIAPDGSIRQVIGSTWVKRYVSISVFP